MKKFLSLTLALLMVVAAFATFAVSSSAAEQTYTKVTTAPSDWTGTYLIAYDGEDETVVLDAASVTDVNANKTENEHLALSNGTITGDYSTQAVFVAATEGGYSIQLSNGVYIGNNAKNKLNAFDTPNANTFSITEGVFSINSVETGAPLQYNASATGGMFRYYGSASQKAISIYKLTSGTVAPPSIDDNNGGDDNNGDDVVPVQKEAVGTPVDYVVFHSTSGMVMTATADGSKLAGVEATANADGTLTVSAEGYAVITVVTYTDGTFTATCGGKYLTSGETGSALTLESAPTAYSYWLIEEIEGETYYKNEAALYGGSKPQYLEYYNGFTTYGFNATSAAQYQFDLYEASKVSVGAVDDDNNDDNNGGDDNNDTPIVKEEASTSKTVVFFGRDNLAMTATFVEGSNKLAGVEATVNEDGTLTVPGDDYAVWTVTVYTDGTFSLATADGKFLTSTPTGGGVTLEETANEYSYWMIEELNGVTLYKNAAANYNGKPQYLEYYNGFTTYGAPYEGQEAAYTFTTFTPEQVNPDVQAGDATVILAVLAIVALFGTAVIVKKAHD